MIAIPLLVAILVLYYVWVKWQRRGLPPGPFPYPLIGNIVEIYKANPENPWDGFSKLAAKYGNVFMARVGIVDSIFVNGNQDVREAMANLDEILDKCDHEWALDRSFGSRKYGLFLSSTNAWKNNRRFTIRTLKDFGFGKFKDMDSIILEQCQDLVAHIKDLTSRTKGVLHVDMCFNPAMVNIIYGFLTGRKFQQNDPELAKLVRLEDEWFRSTNIGFGALGAWPFLYKWAPGLTGFRENHRSNVNMNKYFEGVIAEFRRKGDYKTNPTNFIEVALQRIDGGPKHPDYDEPIFTDKNLICLLNDLFGAGSETTANSLSFAVRNLIHYPEIQAKIQAEVDALVGRDRWPTLSDKPNLRYTEAFTYEVLRFNTVTPATPRKAISKCSFRGYEIPEGTNVVLNIWSGDHDEGVWGDPFNFRPERWLNPVTGELVNTNRLVTFSFGKRDCIGQSLAKSTVFMAVASLVQQFTFGVDPASGPPGNECTKTITIAPVPFNTLVKVR